MALKRVMQAEAVLKKAPGLTSCGETFLVERCDPFHDTPLPKKCGAPEGGVGTSCVYQIKQSVELSTPSLGTAWDCHIILWPFLVPMNFQQSITRYNDTFTINNTNGPILGGVQAFGTAPGVNLNLATSTNLANVVIDPQYSQGAGRLIGVGFEVTNDTAEINKQGSCFVYRQNQPNLNPATFDVFSTTAPPTYIDAMSGQMIRHPPVNTDTAMLLPGSLQWLAAEGCYVVGVFNHPDSPFIEPSYVMPLIQQVEIEELESPELNNANLWVPTLGNIGTQYYTPAVKMYNLQQSGAIFSGLNAESTLRLTVIFYYEQVPGLAEGVQLQLSQPLSPYDPVAKEIYSHAMGAMPPGVKQGENGLGDWFLDCVQAAAGWFGGPIGTAVSLGIKGARSLANKNFNTPNPTVSPGKGVTGKVVAKPISVNKAIKKLDTNPRPIVRKVLPPTPPPRSRLMPKRGSRNAKRYGLMSKTELRNLGFNPKQIELLQDWSWEEAPPVQPVRRNRPPRPR